MNASLAWIAPIVVSLITAAGAYIAVYRKASGRISTTEATTLWAEASSLRDVYKQEIGDLRKMITDLDEELDLCEKEQRTLQLENDRLKRENDRLTNHASV